MMVRNNSVISGFNRIFVRKAASRCRSASVIRGATRVVRRIWIFGRLTALTASFCSFCSAPRPPSSSESVVLLDSEGALARMLAAALYIGLFSRRSRLICDMLTRGAAASLFFLSMAASCRRRPSTEFDPPTRLGKVDLLKDVFVGTDPALAVGLACILSRLRCKLLLAASRSARASCLTEESSNMSSGNSSSEWYGVGAGEDRRDALGYLLGLAERSFLIPSTRLKVGAACPALCIIFEKAFLLGPTGAEILCPFDVDLFFSATSRDGS